MTTRDQVHKWFFYALGLVPIWVLDAFVLNRIAPFGVIPMLLPLAVAAVAVLEGAYAGTLIEQCGLRGFRIGDACVSEKHCGFIVNLGNASCKDIETLIEKVQQTVFEKTGYKLEPEVRKVGDA